MRPFLVAVMLVAASVAATLAAPADAESPLVKPVRKYSGFRSLPVAIQFAPDGRLFVAEWMTGDVRVIENGTRTAPLIHVNVVTGFELGLTEMSLHPDFANEPYVYLFYTYGTQSGWASGGHYGRLSRFRETAHNQFGAEEILVDRLNAGVAHNDGIIAWGPDGKLYFSHGDVTRYWVAQQRMGWDGRILRLNDDGTIPADNPMGPTNPTWSFGHRAPYGLDFHPLTHELFVTENSDNVNDEINLALPGHNYGWPAAAGCSTNPAFTDPLLVHARTIGPTNGIFYRGTGTPDLTGKFLFADTNTGRLYALNLRPPTFQRVVNEEIVLRLPGNPIIDLVNGPDGYLWFTTFGGIYRLETAQGTPPAQVIPDAPYVPPRAGPGQTPGREHSWALEPGLCVAGTPIS